MQIIDSKRPWIQESIHSEFLTEHMHAGSFDQPVTHHIALEAWEQLRIQQYVHESLTRIQPYLDSDCYRLEKGLIEQLKGYVFKLRVTTTPKSAEEKFSELFALQRVLFWVPITILSHHKCNLVILLVLAYSYATLLALEPIFRDVGAAFLSDMAFTAINEALQMIDKMRGTPPYNQAAEVVIPLLDFPRETAINYKNRQGSVRQQLQGPGVLHSSIAVENLCPGFGY